VETARSLKKSLLCMVFLLSWGEGYLLPLPTWIRACLDIFRNCVTDSYFLDSSWQIRSKPHASCSLDTHINLIQPQLMTHTIKSLWKIRLEEINQIAVLNSIHSGFAKVDAKCFKMIGGIKISKKVFFFSFGFRSSTGKVSKRTNHNLFLKKRISLAPLRYGAWICSFLE
jgi:hypothetical protein